MKRSRRARERPPRNGIALATSSDTRGLVRAAVADALKRAQADGALPPVPAPEIRVERPAKPEHGDYACNVAMRLASAMRMPPLDVANAVAARIERGEVIGAVEVARPGFLNLRAAGAWKRDRLAEAAKAGARWGRIDAGGGRRVQVEFVSANPTGPLQVGNGRGAVLGDALAAVLDAAGYDVQREYYVNDAGAQTRLFGRTLLAGYLQALGREAEVPPEGYRGAYMAELGKRMAEEHGERWIGADPAGEDGPPADLTRAGLDAMLDLIRADLELVGVRFDRWASEQALYEPGDGSPPAYEQAMGLLRDGGHVVERDGAVWFRSKALAEDETQHKDNVLIRTSGEPTYFASDAAYHYDKFIRRGFETVIDVWGADHQGHVARTKAAVGAVGGDPEALEVLLYQLVHLVRSGERVRISKRTGEFVTLRELVEEVGADATRFFMLQRSADAQMDFDLGAAESRDPRKNPVTYARYAHARACSILRNAEAEGLAASAESLDLLSEPKEELLISAILRLPELVADMAERREPHHLTTYATELAQQFTQFYDACRVVDAGAPERSGARLTLVRAAQSALAAALGLIGASAPREM